jgi:hypothetical protein
LFFPVSAWFAAFVLTLAVETPIVMFVVCRPQSNFVRLGIVIVFANLATHLAVWYVVTQLILVGTLGYTLVAETWAVAAEAILYWAAIPGLSARRAVAAAVAANGASFLIGQFIRGLWPDLFG